ncbi:helix-turn-helix transcriptional regulator [Alicyclobacillus shizuokensis]|uniref:helix-turn-helix transcriptional regulator n=1 Tax=Alicyclobacillus shizuokensis TaxID=392014 RepID=UPI0008371680|nr:helix-turn-helix transcriptional regulator [Alicyclobacillus shizuokensis]
MDSRWLERIRKSKGMTQEQVAVRAGVSRQYIGMLEGGHRKPSVPIAKRIANVLEIPWTIFYADQCHELFLEDHTA